MAVGVEVTLDEELAQAGFELLSSRANSRRYARRTNPYLQFWVVVNADGTAEVQWEFALGEYLVTKGFHASVQDELSLLIYPKTEARGPADPEWVAAEIARTEALLGSVDLVAGL